MGINNRQLPADFDAITAGNVGTNAKRLRDLESHNNTWMENLALAPVAVAIGAFDTLAQSVTPDSIVDETTIEDSLYRLNEKLGQYYSENKEGVQLAGDIGLSFVPIFGASKLIRAGGYFDKVLQSTERGKILAKYAISSGRTRKDILNDMNRLESTFLNNKTLSADEIADTALSRAIRKEQFGAAGDMFKESVAVDLGILATMNESNLMFPDDVSSLTNFAMFAVPDLALTGLAFRFTKTAILKHLAARGKEMHSILNEKNLDLTATLSFEGTRGPALAVNSTQFRLAENDFTDVESSQALRQSGKQRMNAHKTEAVEDVTKLFNDNYFGHNISKNEKLTPAAPEVQNFLAATLQEPTLGAGVQDLAKLHPNSNIENQRLWGNVVDSLKTEKKDLLARIDTAKPEKKAALQKKLDILEVDLNKQLKAPHQFVLEVDHSITPLNERRFLPTDDTVAFSKAHEIVTDGGETILKLKQEEANRLHMDLGVTENGKLLLTQPEQLAEDGTILGGVNLTSIITKTQDSITRESENTMKLTLNDISQEWHWSKGETGKRIFETLAPDLQKELKKWTVGSDTSHIREWAKNNDPRLQELVAAYDKAGFRRRMHEIANENGTVTLFRGEMKAETANPSNDVVSMSTNIDDVAKSFGKSDAKNIIKRDVPVDDILIPVGGISNGHEFEFIVKGNLSRNRRSIGKELDLAIEHLTIDQNAVIWGTFQKRLAKYTPGTHREVFLHPDSNMFELDFAYQLLQKFPDNPEIVKRAAGTGSENYPIKDLALAMNAKKFTLIQQLRNAQMGEKIGMLKLPESAKLTDSGIAKMVNIPNPGVTGVSPLQKAFYDMTPNVGGELRDLRSIVNSQDELDAIMAKDVKESFLGETLKPDRRITGSSLLAEPVENRAPVVIRSVDNFNGRLTPEDLTTRTAMNRVWQNQLIENLLQDAEQADQVKVVAGMVATLMRNPDLLASARRPEYIIEGTGTNAGVFGAQSKIFEHVTAIKSMDTLTGLQQREILPIVNKMFRGENDVNTLLFNKLNSNEHAASLETLNIAANSIRGGWRLLDEPIELENGLFGFALDVKDKFNVKQYKELFDKDLSELAKSGDAIPMPVRAGFLKGQEALPKPVAVDQLGLDGLRTLTSLSHQFLDNLNFLRMLRKLPPIPKKAWHLPAVNLTRGHNLYLTNATGKITEIVSRPTMAEAKRVADEEIVKRAARGETFVIQSEDEVMMYHDSLGDVWRDARNFSYSELGGGASKGKLGTESIEFGRGQLDEILQSLTANFQLLTRHANSVMFEGELNYARTMIRANSLGNTAAKRGKATLFQQYERVALGRSALNQQTPVGKLYYAIESVVDDKLRLVFDKLHAIKPATEGSRQAEFEKLNDKLGDYNPFKTVDDLLKNSKEVSYPLTMRKTVTALNKFTTDMVLRVLDFGMPVVNMASLFAVTPAVTAALRRGADETREAWLSRISALGSPIDDNNALPNTGRMMAEGIRMMFSGEMQAIRKLARDRGYIQQEVAERLNLWTSNQKGWIARNRDNVLDTLSIATDKSEELSRDLAFGMFVSIGKKSFGLQDEAAMAFAHTHANHTIGDFRPTNRPQMFQGAAGMPLGLFTTWAVNWLQRVFGDIEAGRVGASLWQAGVQGFLFGAESFPGAESLIETVLTSDDGKRNIADSLDAKLGTTTTDLLLHGSLSSVTGIAFETRGGISLPNLYKGEDLNRAIPSVSVLQNLYTGISETIQAAIDGGASPQRVREIWSNYAVNGFAKNVLEIANGQSVDRQGRTINDSIREWESLAPRMFEAKSVREIRQAQLMQRDRAQQQIEMQKRDRLNQKWRSAFRDGKIDKDLIEDSILEFKLSGGDSGDLLRLIRQNVVMSSFDRGSRELLKALNDSDDQGKAMRWARVTMDDD